MIHKLLWTGGFDSTFRLCQLVHDNEEIQPIYIEHPMRPSLPYELEAQRSILEYIRIKYPNAKIHPVIYVKVETISFSKEIHNVMMRIRKEYPIGLQYEWLASYADTNPNCELCHEGFVRRRGALGNFLENNGSLTADDNGNVKLDTKKSSADVIRLFGNFYFPVIHLNNLDMIDLLYQWNMEKIFSLIRFCESSQKDACGVCSCCNGKFSVGAKEFQFTPLARKHHLIFTCLKNCVLEQKRKDKTLLSDFYKTYINYKKVNEFEAKHYQVSLPYLIYIAGILSALDSFSDDMISEIFKQADTFEKLSVLITRYKTKK